LGDQCSHPNSNEFEFQVILGHLPKGMGHAVCRRLGTRREWGLRRHRPSASGMDRAEALANVREAIELYIEDCREAEDPIPTEIGREFVDIEAA
jgi:hypothetical protein